MREIDLFFLQKDEPVKGCLIFLRDLIKNYDEHITEAWKYNMPFYCYKGKMCCYLWVSKKTRQPYIGFTEGRNMQHPALVAGDRSRMKVIEIDSTEDIPVVVIKEVLDMAIGFYKK